MARYKYSKSYTPEQVACKASNKYRDAMYCARERGIEWKLTFQEWWDWWQASGHWNDRGPGSDKYCMCRKGDTGPYELDNIYCATNLQNQRDGTAAYYAKVEAGIIYKNGYKLI